MDELFSKAFGRLSHGAPEGPDFESLAPGGRVDSLPGRRTPPVLIGAGIVGLAVVIALPLMWWVGRNESPPATEEDMIPYVRIHWRVEAEHECPDGLPIEDNGGFEEAVVEMWGPTSDGYLRIDATVPDGTVEQVVIHGFDPGASFASQEDLAAAGASSRSWSTHDRSTFWSASPFRILTCGGQLESRIPTGPGGALTEFVGVPRVGDAYTAGIAESPRTAGVWRGVEVSVVEMWKTAEGESLWWFDEDEGRVERIMMTFQGWRGRSVETHDVVERADVPAASVSFATDRLVPTWFGAPIAGDGRPLTVPYTKLSWELELELDCEPEFDNHGFESATVEIYGPSPEGIMRYDATAPDGTIETVVIRGVVPGQPAGEDVDVWASADLETTVFRSARCVGEPGAFPRDVNADGPLLPTGDAHLALPRSVLDEWYALYEPAGDLAGTPGWWRGTDVVVYRASASSTTDLGRSEDLFEEWWYDGERERLERWFLSVTAEGHGKWSRELSVMERSLMPVPIDFFSTNGSTSSDPEDD